MSTTKARLNNILQTVNWTPQPGSQLMAWNSKAQVIGFGGSAAGGKSDLGLALALYKHRRSLIVRKERTQLTPIIQRIEEIIGDRKGYNGQSNVWSLGDNRFIQFAGVANPGDSEKVQGAAKDYLFIDEATAVPEEDVKFLMAWVRSAIKGQETKILLASNPPLSAEGEWYTRWFSPWVSPSYEGKRAGSGEIRYFATIDNTDTECPNGETFLHKGERIKPMSRTFVHSNLNDNRYLKNTDYRSMLQSMAEPLKQRLLYGNFGLSAGDDEFQVIKGADVERAMNRWEESQDKGRLISLGCDPARTGSDNTLIFKQYENNWFDKPGVHGDTPTGGSVAALLVKELQAADDWDVPIMFDPIGIGAAVADALQAVNVNSVPLNFATKVDEYETDVSGLMGFANLRALVIWRLKELLGDETSAELCLPPDDRLKSDLCAPRYLLNARGKIQIEDKLTIRKRLGRSTDYLDALALCAFRTPNIGNVRPVKVVGLMGRQRSQF